MDDILLARETIQSILTAIREIHNKLDNLQRFDLAALQEINERIWTLVENPTGEE